MLAPDEVVNGSISVSANIWPNEMQAGSSSSSTGWVDPIVSIANQTIPESSANYRDHYEIEYAPGYWALGSTPVQETTWGRIKQLYAN